MTEEGFYQISLSCIPGIGSQTIKQLLSYCGSPENIFKSTAGKLRKIPGIGEKTVSLLKNTDYQREAERKIHLLDKHKVHFCFFSDKVFPERLRHCVDSPVILYYKGKPEFNQGRVLSIVGTRNATNYGKILTERIVADLKPYSAIVVSGLAYGIDIAAHKAALNHGMITWSIIAGGHDKIYPAPHYQAYQQIIETGCVISEYLPEEIPEATNFPERNRIIAGISDGTVVVEAKEKGGALITADIANSYDREVFATPGPVDSASSTGCHNLIKEHKAHLVTSGEDIAKLLGWDELEKVPPELEIDNFTEEELAIISLLRKQECHIDDLSWKLGLPLSALASHLLTLEMQGKIKALPGKKFRYTN